MVMFIFRIYAAFSIAADIWRYTLSFLQSLIAYFIGRKSVSYFGLVGNVS